MACEIAVAQSLSEAFVSKRIQKLEDSVMDFVNGYNLANPKIGNLFIALTGKQIRKQSFWKAFERSAGRRNKIIHGGFKVGKAEAEEALKAAFELVDYVKKKKKRGGAPGEKT